MAQGFPITHEVYPGNTNDKTTPEVISKKLKERFGVKECIFIGDRGREDGKKSGT